MTRIAAFLIGHLEGELQMVERARQAVREMNALCKLLEAKRPKPWVVIEAEDLTM